MRMNSAVERDRIYERQAGEIARRFAAVQEVVQKISAAARSGSPVTLTQAEAAAAALAGLHGLCCVLDRAIPDEEGE